EPWRVVLAGRPNVGKSSLINALVGYNRSIVYDMPGTTRDVVTAITAIDGWPVELSDTAGLRAGSDSLEQAGVQLAREQLTRADLVVLVFDMSQAWPAADDSLISELPSALVVHNKCVLPPATEHARPPGILTSAVAGTGLADLERAIARRLVADPPVQGEAVVFAENQIAVLGHVLAAIESGDMLRARQFLA